MKVLRPAALCLAAFSAILPVSGCAGSGAVPSQPVPERRAPSSYLPGDLDVALTLDLARMRSTLPESERLGSFLLGAEPEAEGSASAAVSAALLVTNRVWIGLRPSVTLRALDSVMILEGNFSGAPSEARTRGFLPGRDLGRGLVVFEAREAKGRSAPARLYSWNEELWIVATTAELDAVERTVEDGVVDRPLAPPSRGVVSVAVRVQPLLPELAAQAPDAAALFAGAELLEVSADLDAGGLGFRLDLSFEMAADAARAERALDVLLLLLETTTPQLVGQDLKTEVVANALVVEGRFSAQEVQAWLSGG
jgi:hypothetical protein